MRAMLNAYAVVYSRDEADRRLRLCLYLLTIAGVVFRSELAILVGTITLYLFLTQRISIVKVIIPAGASGLVIGLLCSVSIDSFFWQSFPLWPEWIAFYYNTIQGHSADWGVSPWHFYFANALPRLLLNPATYLLCIPLAVLNASTRRRSLDILIPLLAFVALYSFLPHKEWRFIIYIVPGVTAVSAAGASWIWTRRGKSPIWALLSLTLVVSVLASFMASTALLAVSSLNYPGATALNDLHASIALANTHRPIAIHADNLACQTGVTRFLEMHSAPQSPIDEGGLTTHTTHGTWTYDKTEDPVRLLDPLFWIQFDFVLAERPEKVIGKWAEEGVVYGFGGVRILKPGQESGSTGVGDRTDSKGDVSAKSGDWTDRVARVWKGAEGVLRQRVGRGWWVEVRMEPRIRILRNLMREGKV